MTEVTRSKTHVVVVGGGYAGTLAANHLRQRPDIDITLVNPRPNVRDTLRYANSWPAPSGRHAPEKPRNPGPLARASVCIGRSKP